MGQGGFEDRCSAGAAGVPASFSRCGFSALCVPAVGGVLERALRRFHFRVRRVKTMSLGFPGGSLVGRACEVGGAARRSWPGGPRLGSEHMGRNRIPLGLTRSRFCHQHHILVIPITLDSEDALLFCLVVMPFGHWLGGQANQDSA